MLFEGEYLGIEIPPPPPERSLTSYSGGMVGPKGVEPLLALYKNAFLTVERRANAVLHGHRCREALHFIASPY